MPRIGHKQSEEHKAAIGKALREKYNKSGASYAKPCYVIETGQQFRSQRECARALGVSESTVSEAIKYNYSTALGHISNGTVHQQTEEA